MSFEPSTDMMSYTSLDVMGSGSVVGLGLRLHRCLSFLKESGFFSEGRKIQLSTGKSVVLSSTSDSSGFRVSVSKSSDNSSFDLIFFSADGGESVILECHFPDGRIVRLVGLEKEGVLTVPSLNEDEVTDICVMEDICLKLEMESLVIDLKLLLRKIRAWFSRLSGDVGGCHCPIRRTVELLGGAGLSDGQDPDEIPESPEKTPAQVLEEAGLRLFKLVDRGLKDDLVGLSGYEKGVRVELSGGHSVNLPDEISESILDGSKLMIVINGPLVDAVYSFVYFIDVMIPAGKNPKSHVEVMLLSRDFSGFHVDSKGITQLPKPVNMDQVKEIIGLLDEISSKIESGQKNVSDVLLDMARRLREWFFRMPPAPL